MFTNRNRLAALALGILLSISALQPALSAEDAKIARNFQQTGVAASADSKKQVDDKADKSDSSPDTWYERQSRIPGG
jgi:hypothetical protein